MNISMYQSSVPVFVRMLNNLAEILKKAAAHAETKKIDPAVLLQTRLYPDMFALARQVQIATDTAKGCAARLAGVEPPRYEDKESSFPELLARIDKTIAYAKSIKPDQIDGSEDRPIVLKVRDQSINFTGLAYLLNFALPNFYFHVATAYDLLRHNGVELGKQDFLGRA
ncbi:MAG: hypothetical protein A2W18_13395 [Candidatus Muproteobacteria bacterium RBG_16_60_9]|uniref:DUF1993 domain-containing protein n=1 Tax=Candidatus Muproteobacteria bacterium RBG_16_60_9 TaxID=1817755 RepID=A0A1F6V9R3_9PROT|nr:MAG: hypothetical protein A2W18_13395 [Candidatus Muproteobacteria bacterium RBG_16_60_9]